MLLHFDKKALPGISRIYCVLFRRVPYAAAVGLVAQLRLRFRGFLFIVAVTRFWGYCRVIRDFQNLH